ncbi:unnamed protein product [Closterium sp. NIES-64]|nr:unnamed protein product [Closterium sp. NIES-64]
MGTFAYVHMTPDKAKWMFPELRKVRRVGGEQGVVDVPVTYAEVQNGPTGDRRTTTSDEAVDEAEMGNATVDVQWPDVELWSYDLHPVQGARPSSVASAFIVHAHAGAGDVSRSIGGTTPWANADELTGDDGMGGSDPPMTNPASDNEGAVHDGDAAGSGYGQSLPRWVGRRKRKRGGDAVHAGDEESTVAQRFGSHFFHVMMHAGRMKEAGTPMTPDDVAREIGTAPNHWAGDHSGAGSAAAAPRDPLDAKSSEFELVNPLPLLPVLGSLDHRHRQPLQSSSKEGPSKVSLPSFHFLDTATTRPPKSARPSRVAPLASHNI